MANTEPDPSEIAAQPIRLMLDTQSELTHARLRSAAAVLALCAGAWLAWVEGRWWLRVTAFVSLAFAMRWLSTQRAAFAALAESEPHYLEIAVDKLTIAAGPNVRVVPRDAVRAVELDDDRLVVLLCLQNGEELAIEPRYGRLTLRELGETLQRALCAHAHRGAPG
jgi:hypothetical protein